jgi:outer membrane protein OmpA-like peptidoglycan-associated protein
MKNSFVNSVVMSVASAVVLWGCATPQEPPKVVEKPIDFSKRPRVIDSPEGARIVFPAGILFEFNQTALSSDAGKHFDDCQFIYERARGGFVVEGHTDARGTESANRVLSRNRATAVMQELVARKIAPSRITVKPMAFDKPAVAAAKTDEEHAQNRRAEVILVNETVASLQAQHGCGKPPETAVAPAEQKSGSLLDRLKGAVSGPDKK